MKKKLLTLLALIVGAVGSAWGDPTYKSDFTDLTSDGNGKYYTYLTSDNYATYISAGWMTYTNAGTGSATLTIDPATDETISGSEATYGKIKATSRYMDFYVTGITSIKFYFRNNSGSDTRTAYYKLNEGSETSLVEITKASCGAGEIELDGSANNHIQIYSGSNQEIFLCALKVSPIAVVGPSFTMSTPTATTNVAINTNVVLTADEDITAVGSTIAGTVKAGDTDATDITFSLSGRTLTYTPESPLAYNTTYVVKLSANQVQNGESEKNAEKNFTFTTMAVPSTSTTVNAAASNKDVIFDNSGTISADTKTLSLADVPITIVGSQKFQSGSNNYKFTIGGNDYPAIKVSKGGTYVVTPGSGVTVNSVTAYATSNSDSKSAISSPGKDEAELNPRGTSGTPVTPAGYPLGKNESGDFQFTIGGEASQAIVVLVINYDCSENVDVNISAAGYATLYFDSNLIVPTGVTAYKAAVNGENIALTDIGNLIPANTGVILKADAGKYNFMTSTDDASNVDISGNILTGTVTGTSVSANSVYTLGQNSEGIVGLRLYTGTSIRAYSAYSTSISSAPSFMEFNFIGESTGVNFVKNQMENVRGDFYNLNGQRVAQPTKGLYIVNGRKVIMK